MTDLIQANDNRAYVHVTTKLTISGDFFRRNPSLTIRHNIKDMLAALSVEMQDVTRNEISSHSGSMPGWSGWTLEHTEGYVTSAKTGHHWSMWAAVGAVTAGMSKADAIRTKAAAVSIEKRWHPYRDVKSSVYRARAVIGADLAKGLE